MDSFHNYSEDNDDGIFSVVTTVILLSKETLDHPGPLIDKYRCHTEEKNLGFIPLL